MSGASAPTHESNTCKARAPATHLCAQVRHDDVHERRHQRVPYRGLAPQERLRAGVVARRPALDQIARERERGAGEPDQRHIELGDQQPNGLERVRLVLLGHERAQPVEVALVADGLVEHRAATRLHADREPDRHERDDDVAEQDRRVHRHPPKRLERDLDGFVGVAGSSRGCRGHRAARGTRAGIGRPAA